MPVPVPISRAGLLKKFISPNHLRAFRVRDVDVCLPVPKAVVAIIFILWILFERGKSSNFSPTITSSNRKGLRGVFSGILKEKEVILSGLNPVFLSMYFEGKNLEK